MAATRRLFYALWPDDGVRRQVADAARQVIGPCGGKGVPAERYHITLAFLGDVPAEQYECVSGLGDGLVAGPFTLILDTFGFFPRAQAVWLGASVVPPPLADLQGQLAGALPCCGLVAETRPYHPHLTLVRKARRGPDPAPAPGVAWPVNEFVLVESELSSEGSEYRVRRRWVLSERVSG